MRQRIRTRALVAAIAVTLFIVPCLMAQTLTTGDLTGVITDSTGAIVPGVEVTLKHDATNETRTVLSNEAGRYRFSLLTPGDYTRRRKR